MQFKIILKKNEDKHLRLKQPFNIYLGSFQLVHLFQDLWRAFDHTVQYLSIINLVIQISKLYTNLYINIWQQKPFKRVFITALIKRFIQMEEGENILFWERS